MGKTCRGCSVSCGLDALPAPKRAFASLKLTMVVEHGNALGAAGIRRRRGYQPMRAANAVRNGLLFLLAMASAGCSKPPKPAPPPPKPKTKHVPPTPIDLKKAELGEPTWNSQWTKIVEKNVTPAMLSRRVPRDVVQLCPRFYTMKPIDKRAFWAYFFQALAGAEAGLNPKADVKRDEPELARMEKIPPSLVRTEGLLQLTYADAKRYGCDFNAKADARLPMNDPRRTILEPRNNLLCGIRILDNQMFTLHRPILWSASYWATLRPGTFSEQLFAKQMTNPPLACGKLPRVTESPETHREVAE